MCDPPHWLVLGVPFHRTKELYILLTKISILWDIVKHLVDKRANKKQTPEGSEDPTGVNRHAAWS
ncbi:MAG: hypothetical protein A2Z11_02540 [Candidatus Woykebacteria bacterium RBG_16_43_9]|uniref:Uncharacterized protein n=1 Tax=Candidatus Woykebacteria bacterium RBG_16_43_9 TaxID=1802596 RepID=A0A1G1WFN7_9BACT|nr:MAG: hypothetical protein A2Z11_02540 [Candidatus Woykebacteria bacterium RBG_16_43_9]